MPQLSMLRIKSENGEQTFLLMMWPEDTIGGVRALLGQARWVQGRNGGCSGSLVPGPTTWPDVFCPVPRGMDPNAFEIFSAFPPKVYSQDELTLQDAGLVPNANLLLRPSRALPPAHGPQPSSQPK